MRKEYFVQYEEIIDLDEVKADIVKAVKEADTQLTVNVSSQSTDEDADIVTMNVFNSEIISNLIYSVVSHFLLDMYECSTENSDFTATVTLEII